MIEDYCSGIKPEDIWIFPNISPAQQRRFYDKESVIHPAKMPTFVVQKIIADYTKPGEIVLDPMAGIGTTIIEAVLMGRNAVGVEYEEKFFRIIERNLKSIEPLRSRIPGMGNAVIFKGDSRELAAIMETEPKVDSVVFSPPYSDISLRTGVDLKGRLLGRILYDKRKFTQQDFMNVSKHDTIDEEKGDTYSKDEKNIGNLPHGNIDAIVTSPPYSEMLNASKNSTCDLRYTEETKDKTQIGNLMHGTVDAVITSPPFSETLAGAGINKQRAGDVELSSCGNPDKHYTDNNIAKLKHGEIDTIITSPPYSHPSYITQDQAEGKTHDSDIAPRIHSNSEGYGESPDNIGNMQQETYLQAMLKVYRECFLVLRSGGIMALVTKNFVRKTKMIRLDLDTIKLCEAAGFTFKERKYRRLEKVSFWIRNAKKKYYEKNSTEAQGDPYAEYEDILVFTKEAI